MGEKIKIGRRPDEIGGPGGQKELQIASPVEIEVGGRKRVLIGPTCFNCGAGHYFTKEDEERRYFICWKCGALNFI